MEEFEDFEEFEEAAFEELEIPEEFESFFSEEFTDEEMEILEEEFADEFTGLWKIFERDRTRRRFSGQSRNHSCKSPSYSTCYPCPKYYC